MHTDIRVVFLQHPRERRTATGTCRMAHLGLANSELHCGVAFADLPRAVGSAASGSALLFPGPGATLPDVRSAPQTLVVIDGTWSQARSLLRRNPYLSTLPRLGLAPVTPSTYRIRREPAPHCLSTVEAVVDVLVRLEGDAARFAPLLQAFERMVTLQLDCAARRAAGDKVLTMRAAVSVDRDGIPP